MFKEFQNIFTKKDAEKSKLGLNLKAGDNHYRAYIGPPKDYDIISAMVFNLVTNLGLRQNHRVLDIGCGSLRIGRLLIPYLNERNYIGVEPNKWLVSDGIKKEIGKDLVRIKKPTFSFRDSLDEFNTSLNIDFAIAQSIFSHTGTDLLAKWIKSVSFHLKDSGALIATFYPGENDFTETGWFYPENVSYSINKMQKIANENGLSFRILNWKHPRQTWALYAREKFNDSMIDNGNISWNALIDSRKKQKRN